jgi:hypothetical protein
VRQTVPKFLFHTWGFLLPIQEKAQKRGLKRKAGRD